MSARDYENLVNKSMSSKQNGNNVVYSGFDFLRDSWSNTISYGGINSKEVPVSEEEANYLREHPIKRTVNGNKRKGKKVNGKRIKNKTLNKFANDVLQEETDVEGVAPDSDLGSIIKDLEDYA